MAPDVNMTGQSRWRPATAALTRTAQDISLFSESGKKLWTS
jgi:hypothetical protein